MTPARASLLAWTLCALTSLVAISRVVLAIVDPASSDSSSAPGVPGGGVPVAIFDALVLVALAVVGAVVASRRSRNAVGWILCVIPLFMGLPILGAHAFWAITLGQPAPGPAAEWVAWVATWTWVPAMLPMVTLFPLLFPTGRPPTPRWQPVIWISGAAIVLVLFTEMFRPGRFGEFPVDNPLDGGRVVAVLQPIGDLLWVVATIASIASLVVRFRKSHGEERQQIKWIVVAAITFVLLFAAAAVLQNNFDMEIVGFAVILSGFLVIASAVAVAMLRYRLYDIDVVINRALVYGALTAMLAAAYLGSVLLLQLALRTVTQGSGLAVAASTLATAALFRPLRSRTQAIVDHRFFRSKYDAARTLAAFGTRLRDEVDLDTLTTDVRAVVAQTVQPAHVTLWVRSQENAP